MTPFKSIFCASPSKDIIGMVLANPLFVAEANTYKLKLECTWTDTSDQVPQHRSMLEIFPVGMGSSEDVVNYIDVSIDSDRLKAFAEKAINKGKLVAYSSLPSVAQETQPGHNQFDVTDLAE